MFTGAPAKDAAAQNAGLFSNYQTNANGFLNTGLTNATNAVNTGTANATGAVQGGVATATPFLNNAISSYAPLSALGQKYGGATSLLLDSYGVNGAAGNARATDAFQAGPGYQYNVDQNVDQVARKEAALGMADSGNTLTAIQDRANQLANQEYNNWRTGLSGFVSPELQATSGAATGQAAGYTNLGNMAYGAGNTIAGIDANAGNTLAGISSADAMNRANVAGTTASGIANSNNQSATSQMNANSQFWNGLLNLGGNAAKAFIPTPKAA